MVSPYVRPIILRSADVCYVEVPKAGSSSVLTVLADISGIDVSTMSREQARQALLRSKATLDARIMPRAVKTRLLDPANGLWAFTFVRNPYVRVLSAYIDLVTRKAHGSGVYLQTIETQRDPSFEQFARRLATLSTRAMNPHLRPQSDIVDPENISYDFIGCLESFNEDLSTISARLGSRSYHSQGREHRTDASRVIGDYYTEDIRSLVYARYSADFDLFGYSADLRHVDDPPQSSTITAESCAPAPTFSVASRALAARATRGLNTVQRSPVWSVAWKSRRGLLRLRLMAARRLRNMVSR